MRCDWCGCFLEGLDEEDVIGNTCRECYEFFELKFDREERNIIDELCKFNNLANGDYMTLKTYTKVVSKEPTTRLRDKN